MNFISSFIALTISTVAFASTAIASSVKDVLPPQTSLQISIAPHQESSLGQTPPSSPDDGEDVPHKGGGRR